MISTLYNLAAVTAASRRLVAITRRVWQNVAFAANVDRGTGSNEHERPTFVHRLKTSNGYLECPVFG